MKKEKPKDLVSVDALHAELIAKSKPDQLLEQTLQLSMFQLDIYKTKLANGQELSDKENMALCAYMRTFAQIAKMHRDDKKNKKSEVSQMSDEELRAELAKLTNGSAEDEDESI